MMDRFIDCGWMPMMGFGLLSMVLFWAVLIFGGLFLARWLMGQGFGHREDSALEILKKRYARGEINKQEFEERKRDLLA
ncbi:MAG: electron transporter RnfE [Nitrospira sp. WS238]|nr:electron transporter RnfE [Nitrospira sp. WS238]